MPRPKDLNNGPAVVFTKRLAQGIAQPNGKVAKPSGMTNSTNGTALMPVVELPFGPLKQAHEALTIQAMAGGKVGQTGFLGEPIPGADPLAIVAAIDPISHEWP